MVSREQLVELAPHYLALAVLIFLVLAVLRVVAGDQSLVVELVIAVLVGAAYRPAVRRLGVAPSMWE